MKILKNKHKKTIFMHLSPYYFKFYQIVSAEYSTITLHLKANIFTMRHQVVHNNIVPK